MQYTEQISNRLTLKQIYFDSEMLSLLLEHLRISRKKCEQLSPTDHSDFYKSIKNSNEQPFLAYLQQTDFSTRSSPTHCAPDFGMIYHLIKYYHYVKSTEQQLPILGCQNIWVVKPSCNSKGQGISLSNDLSAIYDSQQMQNRVVQKYIETPLLFSETVLKSSILYKKKFDLRLWVLVKSFRPLVVYSFSKGYLRLCAKQYDSQDILNMNRHLTNYSVNRKSYFGKESESVLKQCYLEELLLKHRRVDWHSEIQPKIDALIIATLSSAAEKVKQQMGCFEVYGFDILLDHKYTPWLLEVNLSPACSQRTAWLSEMLVQMTLGLLQVVLPKALRPAPPKESLYHWRLLTDNTRQYNTAFV